MYFYNSCTHANTEDRNWSNQVYNYVFDPAFEMTSKCSKSEKTMREREEREREREKKERGRERERNRERERGGKGLYLPFILVIIKLSIICRTHSANPRRKGIYIHYLFIKFSYWSCLKHKVIMTNIPIYHDNTVYQGQYSIGKYTKFDYPLLCRWIRWVQCLAN